jgi:hypothetical protein
LKDWKPTSGASGTLVVTVTAMPSAKPTTAPIATAAAGLRACPREPGKVKQAAW